MIRYRASLALAAIAGLLFAFSPPARAAAGDTVQTTGGGWITPSVPVTSTATGPVRTAATNSKATFGFVASATVQADGNLGDFQGELSYHDHGTGLRLHSLVVGKVAVDPTTHTATFSGTAEVETTSGSAAHAFTVTVHDGGEPGVGVDSFDIVIPDLAYEGSGLLGGGNIQVRP